MNFILVEDDQDKVTAIVSFLGSVFPNCLIRVARSFHSGLKAICDPACPTDMVLLDMSMSTYDISRSEPTGGMPESFAGRELLAQMKLRKILVPVIVVTMFDSFGDDQNRRSLTDLAAELETSYRPPFCALVQYSSRKEGWEMELERSIRQALAGAQK